MLSILSQIVVYLRNLHLICSVGLHASRSSNLNAKLAGPIAVG